MCADRISRAKDIGSSKVLTAAKFVDKCVPGCSVIVCALLSARQSRIPLRGPFVDHLYRWHHRIQKVQAEYETTGKKLKRRIQALKWMSWNFYLRRQPVLEYHAHLVEAVAPFVIVAATVPASLPFPFCPLPHCHRPPKALAPSAKTSQAASPAPSCVNTICCAVLLGRRFQIKHNCEQNWYRDFLRSLCRRKPLKGRRLRSVAAPCARHRRPRSSAAPHR